MWFVAICCVAVLALSVVLFVWGHKAGHKGRQITGFVLVVALACGLALAQFLPTRYETMRIVHINNTTNVITLIDNDGKAFYVDTDNIANVGEFQVDGQAYVIRSGLIGDVKFVTPKQ